MTISDIFKGFYGDYAGPVTIIFISLLAGIVLEFLIIRFIKAIISKTELSTDVSFAKSLRGMIVILSLCIGFYAISLQAQLDPDVKDTVKAILTTVVLLLVTSAAGRLAVNFVRIYQGKYKGMVSSISIFTNIAKLIVYTIGLLIVLQTLGISITPILTALGVGGLAVALALKDSLANLFSGLNIIASKQIKPGDFIKVNNTDEGYVQDINWRSTVLRTTSDSEIIIPNSKITDAIITNFSLPHHEISFTVPVRLGYENDLELAEKIAMEEAKKILLTKSAAVKEHEPTVRFAHLDDSAITMNVSLRAKVFADQFSLRHDFIKALHSRFIREGIRFKV